MRTIKASRSLLFVDDDTTLSSLVGEYFEERGYEVDYASDGLSGFRLGSARNYDVVVSDVKMPRMDGLAMCRALKRSAYGRVPVLLLSCSGQAQERILGLQAGADDFVPKPFAIQELEARVKALIQRTRGLVQGTQLQVAELRLDVSNRIALRGQARIKLTPVQTQLLSILMLASPAVVSRSELERTVWGSDMPDSDTLRSHIHCLRKLVDRPFEQKMIHSVTNRGYRLLEPIRARAERVACRAVGA